MSPLEFRTRARAQYTKLGVNKFGDFMKAIGYSGGNKAGCHFYRSGVSKRAILFLEMLEKQK
jgi:hypothetical protein